MSFYLSLVLTFLMPTQLGKHFLTANSFVQGLPVDYLMPVFYLSDILLFLVFVSQIHKLSILFKNRKNIFLAFCILVFGLLNILISKDREVTTISLVRLLLLGNWVFTLTSFSKKQIQSLLITLSFSLVYVTLLTFLQFTKQASIGGLWYWLGERKLDVNNLQTAAIRIGSRLVFRPYSTFSHPNSLAGFTTLTLLLMSFVKDRKILKSRLLYWLIWLSGLACILLTTSRNAYIFGFPLLIISFTPKLHQKLSTKKLWIVVLVISLVSAFVLSFANISLGESIDRRVLLQNQAIELVKQSPFLGVGLGSFTKAAGELPKIMSLGSWLQPVHNIFWLLITETGILGLLLTIYSILLFEKITKNRGVLLLLPLWFILLTGSWDHYWLTLPQNRLIIAFYLGTVLRLI